MTTVFQEDIRCFMCGEKREYAVVASTNAFGPTDLDTRPPEMKRSTMCYWVQTCPECGYTAVDVSDETTVGREFLDSQAYKGCDGIPFASDLAKDFYRHYLIMKAEKKDEDAFYALLHEAWACDDAEDRANAVRVRNMAIGIADKLLASDKLDWRETLSLIRADLLRRASRFDELLEEYGSARYEDDLLNRIIDFEKELARRKHTGCYTVEDSENYAGGSFDWPEERGLTAK